MKKILHIPNYYPPHIGGIEDVCRSIATGLPNFHHQVICFNDKKTDEREILEGITVMRCGIIKKLFSQSVSVSFYGHLKKLLAECKPDIIHFHAPNPLGSVYLLNLIPKNTGLIVHWHGDIVEQTFLYALYRPIERKLLQQADKILVTSPTYAAGSKPLSLWKSKLHVVPNTVNIGKLALREGDASAIEKIRERYGGKQIVFTFGRHVPYKGLAHLINAIPDISAECEVVIAGEGSLTERLKKMSDAPNLHFIGKPDDDELRRYLYASCIFAFPSVTRNEAFGIALAEAMYCGLPAVTFAISGSGVNWVCTDGETGLESDNGDSKAFAEAINRLLNDADLREKLSVNAKERVRKLFVFEEIKADLERIYETS
ncbi:MAG: glycosyltransferase [Dysgonamonadaceae bacterium]|jgi:glycosyltransferase involved in cell wall biosynthesis|nr:glycosyltransferase [Dysgonamonadaceae bacterium]